MAAARADIAVLGASGFTGAWISVALARAITSAGRPLSLTLAGRDTAKLSAVAARVRTETAFPGDIRITLADVTSPPSLAALARGARVVVNAAGPFRFLGEPVVAACVAQQAHYIDITGEPEFIEAMELCHGDAAAAAGVAVVSSCGIDSVPADVGVDVCADALRACGAVPSSVESYLTVKGGPQGLRFHDATYATAVHSFGSVDELKRVRRAYAAAHPPPPGAAREPLGPRLPRRDSVFRAPPPLGAPWAFPFLGADVSVVRRSQRLAATEALRATGSAGGAGGDAAMTAAACLGAVDPAAAVRSSPPLQYAAYMTLPSTWAAARFAAHAAVFRSLASRQWGRDKLLARPDFFTAGLFTPEGPTREQIASARFEMTLVGTGYSAGAAARAVAGRRSSPPEPCDVGCTVRVSGGEPFYDATSRMVAACAVTLLEEEAAVRRGCVTPAHAFRGTRLVERLAAGGVHVAVTEAPARRRPHVDIARAAT